MLAVQNTIEYAEDEAEKTHRAFFDFDALEGDSEFVDPEGEAEGIRPLTPGARGQMEEMDGCLERISKDEAETADAKFMNEPEENIAMKGHEEPEEPEVAQGLKVAQGRMAFGLSTPPSCARLGWFKSARN